MEVRYRMSQQNGPAIAMRKAVKKNIRESKTYCICKPFPLLLGSGAIEFIQFSVLTLCTTDTTQNSTKFTDLFVQ